MEYVQHMFSPVFDKGSKILILGTMPSPKSRENGFYYSHPQNRFWRILSELLSESLPEGRGEKEAILLKHHIALWDVLKSCEIRGASDSSIQKPQANDLSVILQQAKIRAIFTTGRKAEMLYQRYCFPQTKRKAFYLPSTSPANCARYRYEDLLKEYRIILDYLK